MKFQIGRYYRHASGLTLYVAGMAATVNHGLCLIAEYPDGEMVPVGSWADNAVNWFEVDQGVWAKGKSPVRPVAELP